MSNGEVLATADIVVVGAGIVGLCTAWELKQRGFGVLVVDQRFPAYGASGRNPGALWVQTRRTGTELSLARAGKKKYQEYRDTLGDVFDLRTDGGLFFFETDEQAEVMAGYVKDRRASGVELELIGRAEAAKLSPILPGTAIGAVFSPEDAQIDPQQFLSALEAACTRAKVRIFRNTAVLSALRDGDRVVGVRSVRGEIHASGVVWATGAWASALPTEGVPSALSTVRIGQLMMQPVESASSPVLHGPRGVHGCGALTDLPQFAPEAFATPLASAEGDARGFFNDTAMLNQGGSLYIGHSIDGHGSLNPHISLAATQVMAKVGAERYPQYAEFGVTGLWAGLGSETPDQLPIVGPADGAYVNVGHDWGISSGPACGQVLAEIIAGEHTPYAKALRADRAALRTPRD
ncbi:FAD-dependent oxidoreductase [Streptomyces sp. NPDC000151]|uniref:NAD(P)/FAD-dependent oxidoreductase n=1 Tax=Streptomyces sp. NPDC000151 TaxID=3154244 RepID=UPI00332E862A